MLDKFVPADRGRLQHHCQVVKESGRASQDLVSLLSAQFYLYVQLVCRLLDLFFFGTYSFFFLNVKDISLM